MEWFKNLTLETILEFIHKLASDFITDAFSLITSAIVDATDLYKYYDISPYMIYIYAIAGSLLVVAVVWEGFKQISGGMVHAEEKSLQQLTLQTIFAGMCIFLFPIIFEDFLLRGNNLLVGMIQDIGINYQSNNVSQMIISSMQMTFTYGFLFLVLGIGFLALSIVAGIRYVECVIAYMLGPIMAISLVNKGEGASIYFRESIAIIFTQTLHMFLLQFLINIILNFNNLFSICICIGILIVMIKGPGILRKFVYSTGTGSAVVNAAGAGGRMMAMKMMFASLKG